MRLNPCFQVLDQNEIGIAGARFLGTTLWTNFLLNCEGELRQLAMQQAQALIDDFQRMYHEDKPQCLFTLEECASLCQAQAFWLENHWAAIHAEQPGFPAGQSRLPIVHFSGT